MALLSEERIQPSENDLIFLTQKKIYEYARDQIQGDVLDIASGEGYGAKILSEKAKSVLGVDIDSSTVKKSSRKYSSQKVKFKEGDALDIPLKPNSVNSIVSIETIEHVKDPSKLLSEFSRVLKKNGKTIISTPNDDFTEEKGKFHEKEYSIEELKELCKKKFKIEEILGIRWSDRVLQRNKSIKKKRKNKMFDSLIRAYQLVSPHVPLSLKKIIYKVFMRKNIIEYNYEKDILIEKFDKNKHMTIIMVLSKR